MIAELKRRQPTADRGKPNAEPKTKARRQAQPIASLELRGILFQGSWMMGTQTASTGLVTTEFGMNLKAIILGEKGSSTTFPYNLRMHSQQEEPCEDCLLQPVGYCISMSEIWRRTVLPSVTCSFEHCGRNPPAKDKGRQTE